MILPAFVLDVVISVVALKEKSIMDDYLEVYEGLCNIKQVLCFNKSVCVCCTKRKLEGKENVGS